MPETVVRSQLGVLGVSTAGSGSWSAETRLTARAMLVLFGEGLMMFSLGVGCEVRALLLSITCYHPVMVTLVDRVHTAHLHD